MQRERVCDRAVQSAHPGPELCSTDKGPNSVNLSRRTGQHGPTRKAGEHNTGENLLPKRRTNAGRVCALNLLQNPLMLGDTL